MDNNQSPSTPTPETTPVPVPTPNPAPTTIPTPEGSAPATPKDDSSFDFSKTSIIASLSYVGPLVVVPYLTEKENPFVMFHIKQGIVLLVLNLGLWVLEGFMHFLWPLLQLVNFALLVLAIVGIVHALQKKEKELPLVGSFASYIKL